MKCSCTPQTGLCEEHRLKPLELEALFDYMRSVEQQGIEQLLKDLDNER